MTGVNNNMYITIESFPEGKKCRYSKKGQCITVTAVMSRTPARAQQILHGFSACECLSLSFANE